MKALFFKSNEIENEKVTKVQISKSNSIGIRKPNISNSISIGKWNMSNTIGFRKTKMIVSIGIRKKESKQPYYTFKLYI